MNILLASAHPYIPQISGGAQSSTHELAIEFIRRGHNVSVLSGLTADGLLGFSSRLKLKLLSQRYVVDNALGYAVFRSWFSWEVADEVAARLNANVVVLQSGYPVKIALALRKAKARLFIYLRNVELEDLGGDLRALKNVSYIANSRFTAKRYNDLFGIDAEMVHPLVRRENYETRSTRENVTFINPHPLKGLETALSIAERCPEIPFSFIETWTLSAEQKELLKQRIAALGNVTLRPGTKDMKSVYGKAKIVLAPSQWEEAFGRIAAEAHFSGIPVVGSSCGGLPEAIGPGGILVDREASVEEWISAIKRLWHDETYYAEKSAIARSYSNRPEMDRERQLDRLLHLFETPLELATI
ncbi:glycosyltransferase [Mesorhizobium ventifaucium]|uniref:Glycosyltransferase involved in cell wall bisynthesis n=1 Tax=Mesorhizobium ventifaucium TaxID=666020 RepID=A0ABM9DM07_9HYPH|nr:glycosyltransferase [Mesorhizobium ventifaucium]CAH2397563.1 Glycosyltransferase involved in cell wall bisynthesis [Mesorhizobium ventifaucium]